MVGYDTGWLAMKQDGGMVGNEVGWWDGWLGYRMIGGLAMIQDGGMVGYNTGWMVGWLA